jgi:hypothetical protein
LFAPKRGIIAKMLANQRRKKKYVALAEKNRSEEGISS